MRPTGWTLNQCDWCLSKKRLGYRNTEGGQCKETQQEDGHLPSRDNDLRKSHPCPQADLVLWPPELWVNKCVLCKPPRPSLYFLMAAQAHQHCVCVCVCVYSAVCRNRQQQGDHTPMAPLGEGPRNNPTLSPPSLTAWTGWPSWVHLSGSCNRREAREPLWEDLRGRSVMK